MNCPEYQSLLGRWLDKELDVETKHNLESHLLSCVDCQNTADQFSSTNEKLRKTFTPSAELIAVRIADNVISQLPNRSTIQPNPPDKKADAAVRPKGFTQSAPLANSIGRTNNLWHLLGGLAAGFVIAMLAFQPWQGAENNVAQQPEKQESGSNSLFANLAIGDEVEIKPEGMSWTPCSLNAPVEIGSQIRTGDSIGCEWTRESLPTLRMDRKTVVELASPNRLDLRQGRIWISADQASIDVVVDKIEFKCDTGSFDIERRDDQLVLITYDSTVQVSGDNWETQIEPQRAAEISLQGVERVRATRDPVLDTRWMHAILARKTNDPELTRRVEFLLSAMGRAKLQHLHEAEIRSLGHSASGPLIAFLDSDGPENQSKRLREKAAQILGDLAGYEDVEKLVVLLSDDNSNVAANIEKALIRISGRTPSNWKQKARKPDPSDWQRWIKQTKNANA